MSKPATLPFLSTAAAAYRGGWNVLKTFPMFFVLSAAIMVIISLVWVNIIRSYINLFDYSSLFYRIPLIIIVNFINIMISASIIILVIRFSIIGEIPKYYFKFIFNIRVLKYIGYGLIYIAFFIFSIGIFIGLFVLFSLFNNFVLKLIIGVVCLVLILWIVSIFLRVAMFTSYVALDQPFFSHLSRIYYKTIWRFWKIFGLFVVVYLPFVLLFFVIAVTDFYFIDFQLIEDQIKLAVPFQKLPYSVERQIILGLLFHGRGVLASAFIGSLYAEIFKCMEPEFAQSGRLDKDVAD